MKRIIKSIICLILYSQAYSQILNVELEAVDPNLTWPWNWDIVSDGDRLITVNEIGTLNIRQNGVWQNIEIDPNNNQLEPRSVDVDSEGNIWIATLDHGLWSYSMDNVFTNYNTSNSTLPTDKLRVLDIFENFIWISTSDSEGLIRYDLATQESLLFNMDNTDQLKTNGNLDPYIDLDGKVWLDNREFLSIIDTDLNWTSEDFRPIASNIIKDIDFITPEITILSADKGIVKAENGSYDLILEDNLNKYNAYHQDNKGTEWIHYTRITEAFLMVRNNGMLVDINSDSIEGIPSQVFKMIEHQDTIMMVGLLGNQIAKCTFDFISNPADQEKPTSIELFPNPANNFIKIKGKLEQDFDFSIYNLNGQMVKSGALNDNQLPLDGIETGTYFLELLYKDKSVRYREKITVFK